MRAHTPVHSFGVIAYKESPYLVDCIDSLINQTVKSHIYITTSTPSDHIEKIARSYNVEVYVTESGKGIAHDWNFCLHKAKTRYVTLAHQDDIYLPDYTKSLVQLAEKYPDMLIAFSDYAEMKEGELRKNTASLIIKSILLNVFFPFGHSLKCGFMRKKLFSLGSPIATPSVMYDMHNLMSFHFSGEFTVSLDWEAWYRMCMMKGRFLYERKTLMYHRLHKGSETSRGIENKAREKEDMIMFRKLWPESIAGYLSRQYRKSYRYND